MDVYEKFLEFLNFPEAEIPELLPHWRNACSQLGLTAEDVRVATEEWIPEYWDVSLSGVRKCLGAYIRELIELLRFREYQAHGDKLLYATIPCHPACIYANKLSGGARMHIGHPDIILVAVLGAMFNKNARLPGQDASCMNASCSHCGLNRMRTDAMYKNVIAAPTVMWNWGLCCNEGSKTEEYIRELGRSAWDYVLTTLPHDTPLGMFEAENPVRVRYLAEQLRVSQRQVSERTGVAVSDEQVLQAMDLYMAYMRKLETLVTMTANANPQPITGNELAIFGAPTVIAPETGYAYLNEALDEIIAEVRERIARHEGPLPADAPRLACHFVPFGTPWVNKAFLENGVNLSVSTLFPPYSITKKYLDCEDVYQTVAQQWLCHPSAVNTENEAALVSEMLAGFPLDGVLYGMFSFDRWIGSMQKTMIQIVEKRTGIPHFYLEGDLWNDARYRLEDRNARIQSIAHILKINHMVSGWNHVKEQGPRG